MNHINETTIKESPPTDTNVLPIDYGSPSNYFVFLIGNCEEWSTNRTEQGDIALYEEYQNAGVPSNQILYIQDDGCTKSNCEAQLVQFVKLSRPCSTLVFYYAGHAKSIGFSLANDEYWHFGQVVQWIDTLFQGERVLYLLDCCAAGNLCHYLPSTKSHNTRQRTTPSPKQYICLQTSPPYIVTSDDGIEWVLSLCWINCMRSLGFQEDDDTFAQSGDDGNGDHKTKIATIADAMNLLCNRTALVLGDQFYVYVSPGVDIYSKKSCNWVPRRPCKEEKIPFGISSNDNNVSGWQQLECHIPPDGKVSKEWWSTGDTVFYKHPGGIIPHATSTINSNEQELDTVDVIDNIVPPMWLTGRILDTLDDVGSTVKLQIEYPPTQVMGIVEVPRNNLMNDLYMGQTWMVPNSFEATQRRLAKSYKYLDYSVKPQTCISFMDNKAATHKAYVMDWKDFDWYAYLHSDAMKGNNKRRPPFGGHVPVQMESNCQMRLVSIQHITHPSGITEREPSFLEPNFLESTRDNESYWARKAMIAGIESSGKLICNAEELLGTNDFTAFWPEEEVWYDAEPLNPNDISLAILATHAQFTLKGKYCPLLYEDGDRVLSPLHYVRPSE